MSDYLNGRYKIIDELGEGGFGKTFLAEDTHLPSKRKCVIKQFRPARKLKPDTYKEVLKRFKLEAGFLEDLSKENGQIPKLYAFFSEGDDFYIVQELVEGDTLEQRSQSAGRLSEGEVKAILAEILPVLTYTHAKGIIHRDIKPQNIIIRRHDGKPVLIDFGAVKEVVTTVLDAHGTPVRPSIIIGTPGYTPPEQSRGIVVFASDLYSLAMTAITLLTGRQPLELMDPLDGEFRWRAQATGVTEGFADLLDKAVEQNYRDRYRTAEEMLNALRTHIEEEGEREARRLREEEEAARRRVADLYNEAEAALGAEDWPLAIKHLRKLLELEPSNGDASAKLKEAREQQDLADLYATGVTFFKAGRWPEALDALQRIKKTRGNYKEAERLVSECERAVANQRASALYDGALRDVGNEQWAAAIEKLNAILSVEPTSVRAADELRQVELLQELDALYSEGKRHCENEEWEDALACFQKIKDQEKNYKDISRLIRSAGEQLNLQSQREREAQVASLSGRAQASMENEDWASAAGDLGALLKIDPSHEGAAEKLEHCRQKQKLLNLYNRGREYYRRGHWAQALQMFQQVRAADEEYRDVQILISNARPKLQRQRARRRRIIITVLALAAAGLFGVALMRMFGGRVPPVNINRADVTPSPTATPDLTVVVPTPLPPQTPTPTPSSELVTVKLYLEYDITEETVLISLNTAKGSTQKDPDEGNPVVFDKIPCGQNIRLSALYSYRSISDKPIEDFYNGHLGCDRATVDLGRYAVRYDQGGGVFTIEPVRAGPGS